MSTNVIPCQVTTTHRQFRDNARGQLSLELEWSDLAFIVIRHGETVTQLTLAGAHLLQLRQALLEATDQLAAAQESTAEPTPLRLAPAAAAADERLAHLLASPGAA